jgi:hypothetical protein
VFHLGGRPAEIAIVPKDRTIVRRFPLLAQDLRRDHIVGRGRPHDRVEWSLRLRARPPAYLRTRYGLEAAEKPLDPRDLLSRTRGKLAPSTATACSERRAPAHTPRPDEGHELVGAQSPTRRQGHVRFEPILGLRSIAVQRSLRRVGQFPRRIAHWKRRVRFPLAFAGTRAGDGATGTRRPACGGPTSPAFRNASITTSARDRPESRGRVFRKVV